jgi:hypothetical protein
VEQAGRDAWSDGSALEAEDDEDAEEDVEEPGHAPILAILCRRLEYSPSNAYEGTDAAFDAAVDKER